MSEESFKYSSADCISRVSWQDFNKSNPSLSRFDIKLRERWDMAMTNGHFRYDLSHVQTRIVPGKENYVLQLNLKRLKERRSAVNVVSCQMPYDPEKFNFTKVKRDEILFRLEFDRQDLPSNGFIEKNTNVDKLSDDCCNSEKKHCDLIMVNVSPLEYGHILLIPDVDCSIPQRLTLRGIRLALDLLLLSSHPGFRIGFNSLCALASVNHQHLHAWYLDYPLTIETSPASKVCNQFYELTSFPTKPFAFQLHETTADDLASLIHKVANFLQTNNIAHNFFMTRGSLLDSKSDSSQSTIRALIWPRKSVIGSKDVKNEAPVPFNVAVCELGGHIPMYVPEMYDDMTEEYISQRLSSISLPEKEFNAVKDKVREIVESTLSQK